MKKILSIIIVILLLSGTAYASFVATVEYPIMVNGSAMTFDVQPVNIDGRTLLPLRAVSEAVGVPIEWNEAKRQVEIKTIDLEKLKDSCVMIYTESSTKWERGSGVVIDYDEILTCYHVVDENKTLLKATYDDGKERALTITDTAEDKDAAILKPSSTNVKPVKIGDSDDVQVGDTVYVVSSPDGNKNVARSSTVRGLNVSINHINSFEMDPVTLGGSSGGAVFNSQGELIGVIQAGDETLSAAIPINDIRQALAA